MLGLYDSGLGGLTVLAALRRAGVDQDVIYFADQANAPYGERSDTELYTLLSDNFALLASYGVDAIVMACNTSNAVALRRGGFPASRAAVLDLIGNAATALRDAALTHVAVIATSATVRSGAYRRAIAQAAPHLTVIELAAPALVPLVEAGRGDTDEARAAVQDVCRLLPQPLDAIVYGCTHYPLLDEHFAAVLGDGVARIDPAVAQAEATAAYVAELALPAGSGTTHYLTSGEGAAFERNVRRWTGDATGRVTSLAVLADR
jgi:glutamate racemase